MFRGLNSHTRVFPAEMWPSSGGGRPWPIRRPPAGVVNPEKKNYPILEQRHRIHPISAIGHTKDEVTEIRTPAKRIIVVQRYPSNCCRTTTTGTRFCVVIPMTTTHIHDVSQQKFCEKYDFPAAVTTSSVNGLDCPQQSQEGRPR